MGEFFEDEKEQEEKPDKELQLDDMKMDQWDINEIINERNKLTHEVNTRVPPLKQRIGQLNLDLFGDEDNEDWVSKIDELKEIIRSPMTREHPIASRCKEMIKLIQELQIEYSKMVKYYAKWLNEQGKLLDTTIEDYKGIKIKFDKLSTQKEVTESAMLKKVVERANSIQEVTKEETKKVITDGMVNNFVIQYTHLIKEYLQADEERKKECQSEFEIKAEQYFTGFDRDAKEFASRLFQHILSKESNRLSNNTI